MSESLGEAVLTLRTDDTPLVRGIAGAKAKSEQLGKTLDATSGSATRMGGSLASAGRDAASASQGLDRNVRAARDLDAAQKQVESSTKQQKFGYVQLGQQLGDISTMYALGAPPMQIFASQAGQVTQALQMVGDGSSKVGEFLGGPWGTAIQIATIVLLPLIAGLLDTEDAAHKAADAMKQKAQEDETAREALVIYGKTVEAHIEKERRLREEIEKQIQSQRQLNRERAGEAALNAGDLKKDLAAAQKAYDDAVKLEKAANDRMLRPPVGVDNASVFIAAAEAAAARVKETKAALDKAKAQAAEAEKTARMAQIPIMQGAVEGRLDKAKGKVNELTDAIDRLNQAFANKTIGPFEYGRQYALLVKQLEAARKEAKQTAKALGETSRFIMPVSGPTSGKFGEQRSDHRHAGIDLKVGVGTPVKAPAAGTVIEAGTLPGYGNVVFIDHGGGTISRLAHLSRLDVAKGNTVTQGQVVGLSGGAKGAAGSGNSRGPHVHYEVRVNGKPVDPRGGVFTTDALGAQEKGAEAATRAEAEAERARQAELRRKAQFEQDSARIDDRMLDLKARGTVDEAALAQIDRDRVNLAEERYTADLAAQVVSGELTSREAAYLAAKHKLLSLVQIELIDAEERARKLKAGVDVELQLSDLRIELLRAQQSLARTNDQRRDIALAMLAEEEKQVRLQAEATIALFKLGQATKAEAEAAQRRLDQIDQLHPARVEEISRQNAGPLARYLEESNPERTHDRVESYVVNELEQLHKGISDAIADRLGIADPFLKSLISLFIEQVLIRPIAQALEKAQGSSGGGGGGLLGTLFSLGSALLGGGGGGGGGDGGAALSTSQTAALYAGGGGGGGDGGAALSTSQTAALYAGGFDKGGLIPNGSYGVVHDGERVFPTPHGARVVPSSDRRAAGGAPQIAFHNDFRGADAAAVAGIQSRLDRMEAELPGQIVSTMQDARSRFVWRG